MFLYRLELQGFKSFVDRTVVEFGDGLTGIIGPNGCGKTNVSDAIRWVLGEQSAKQLRGDSMEDVIFGGCPTRKPVGMAEVHLTFKNDRGILPTEFSEVTVSRRVFRSGVSEYSINKTPCRLRDVRDLFYDTGMGSHAYSVIERQMVDHVLSDASGHRRFLFEEASGITKYKARKKETLAKLEATETDLTRLNDIVFEIERELRSLARQVGKARKWQRLKDEVRDLDLRLTAETVDALRRREVEAREQWQAEAVRREGVTAALDTLEAALNEKKLGVLELERALVTGQGGLKDREETRKRTEHQIVLLEERAAGLRRRAAESAEEAARHRERIALTLEEERTAEAKRAEIRSGLDEAERLVQEGEQAFGTVEAELRARRIAAADHQQLSLDLFSAEAEKRGACERARERQAALAERREAAERRRAELAVRQAEAERALASIHDRLAAAAEERDRARGERERVERQLEGLAEALHAAEGALARERQDAAAAESRLETLLELKRNFEGVSEGVRALMTGEPIPGVVGVIADVLQAPARLIDALEASLGEASAFVLIEDGRALDPALARLREVPSGRATLVDLSTLAAASLPAIPQDPAVVGRASDLVRCDARYRPLVERLLGSVVMAEDRDAARRLATASEGGLRFVSLDGEVWERGRVRAGSASAKGGLLHREMEIRDLTGQLAERSLAIEALEAECRALQARRGDEARLRDAAAGALESREAAVAEIARERDALESERRWAAGEDEARRQEIETLAHEGSVLARVLEQAEEELQRFVRDVEEARARVFDLDGVVRALEERHTAAVTALQGARDRLLHSAREASEWQERWARAEETRRGLEAATEARTSEERDAKEQVRGLEAEIAGLRGGLDGLMASESEQRERVTELSARFQALKQEVQEGDEEARRARFEQTELNELLHTLELDRVQSRAELDRTLDRLRAEYAMDPDAWKPEPAPAEFDREDAARRLEESRGRLRGLGAVNVLALEDYTRKKERWQFLVRQREDLVKAKEQLLEAIEKINVTASSLFVETFAKVQEHFRDIFRTLFEGGDAELRSSGDDPLECEIEIVAKPRGKHLQSISLMSGGERALTAIALLFAIYLVKPSPFCLLDEVDAPLDDANVERFVRMLKRFSDRTQFVVITHNKKTMESAGALYGVTMQELGVSTLVSVRFDRPQQDAAPARDVEELAAV